MCASGTTAQKPLATSVSTVKAAEGNKPTCKNLNKMALLAWGGVRVTNVILWEIVSSGRKTNVVKVYQTFSDFLLG